MTVYTVQISVDGTCGSLTRESAMNILTRLLRGCYSHLDLRERDAQGKAIVMNSAPEIPK